MERKKKRPETRGRPEIPPSLRKVNLVCRVPPSVKTGFAQRAASRGTASNGAPNSSVGLEVERAFTDTQPKVVFIDSTTDEEKKQPPF
jgi:hypothetical protein